jgi:methionyl-tRNA formyltransferase
MLTKKVLFFGEKGCEYSRKAENHLHQIGFDVQSVFSQKRKEKLPDHVLAWKGDYIFSFRSYYIFSDPFLKQASIAAINFHPAPPERPGSGSINWALYEGDTSYGVTVHIMNKHVDNGPILGVVRFPIESKDCVSSLLLKAKQASLNLFKDFSSNIARNGKIYIDEKLFSCRGINWSGVARKISEVDSLQKIDINCSKEELDKVVRATKIGEYGPEIHLHGYVFLLRKD